MIFSRVLCGIDGSEESLAAARQAARVSEGTLTLVSVLDPWDLVLYGSPDSPEERGPNPRRQAEEALARAVAVAGEISDVEPRVVQGRPQHVLLSESDRIDATLLVVGTHGHGRVAGIVLGSVATAMVHHAHCAVLVARAASDPDAFPREAIVGVDGSEQSVLALAAAAELGARFGTRLRRLAAEADADLDRARAACGENPLEIAESGPVDAIVEAAEAADLVIVGSRGQHGVRALGSVSERVVHRAPCSVLVVRPPVRPRVGQEPHRTTIAEIMSTPPIVAQEDATIAYVARLMLDRRIGAVPIVNERGELTGMVSESDFVGRQVRFGRWGPEPELTVILGQWLATRSLEEIYRGAESLTARDIMTSPVATALPEEPVQQVVERMVHRDLKHVPVVKAGVPVGMVARHDLLKAAISTWAPEE